jgi:hypothetical protein
VRLVEEEWKHDIVSTALHGISFKVGMVHVIPLHCCRMSVWDKTYHQHYFHEMIVWLCELKRRMATQDDREFYLFLNQYSGSSSRGT